jgi:hypothetical protein
MKTIFLKKYKGLSLRNLVADANQDTDAASVFCLREHPDQTEGAIIIVKGHNEANKAYTLLCQHGLITPGKPVVMFKP